MGKSWGSPSVPEGDTFFGSGTGTGTGTCTGESGLVQHGTATTETIEHLGDLELIHLVHRDVAQRLVLALGPHRAGQRVDSAALAIEWQLEQIQEPRPERRQALRALHDHAP